MRRQLIYIILAVFSLINFVLAVIVQVQKNANEHFGLLGKCFTEGGGCATVQTSFYSHYFFGISNPYLGMVFFSVWAALFFMLSMPHPKLNDKITVFIGTSLAVGAVFSFWLLYLQFFVIHAICIYCVWVDIIMIVTTLTYFVISAKEYVKSLASLKTYFY